MISLSVTGAKLPGLGILYWGLPCIRHCSRSVFFYLGSHSHFGLDNFLLGGGCPGHCTMLSSNPDLGPQDAGSMLPPPPIVTTLMSLDTAKCPLGANLSPVENPCSRYMIRLRWGEVYAKSMGWESHCWLKSFIYFLYWPLLGASSYARWWGYEDE